MANVVCPCNPALTTVLPASVSPTFTSANTNRWSELENPPGIPLVNVPTNGKVGSVFTGQKTPELVTWMSVEGRI